ncbi:MAG: chalcone isomerase family protein [Desulfobulbales bacterium]
MKRPFDGAAAAKTLLICAIFVLIFGVQSVAAREIAGVVVPESVTLKNKALVLNGAGIRKKLFMKIYVCALYLTAKRTAASEILADPEAKRIVMSFLYKEVGVERQVEGWNKGFRDNNSGEELKGLQDRINLFNSLFTTVRKGDVIRFDYMPEEGTQVWINDTLNGTVPGEDFFAALLKIWLGPKPAEANLKDALLGNAY